MAAAAALAFVAGASQDAGASTGTDGTDGGSENSLQAAWSNDWALLGLENPGLEPTDLGITEVDTSEYQQEGPYTVGFVSQGPTNSWATIYDETLKAHAEELGVELAYAGADGREDKQVNDINDLLAQDIDALIVTPMDSGDRPGRACRGEGLARSSSARERSTPRPVRGPGGS